MLTPILVPLDGSELALRALAYAETLARAAHRTLVVVRATPALPMGGQARAYVAAQAAALRSRGVAAEPAVAYMAGVPAGAPMGATVAEYAEETGLAIVAAAHEHRASLVVMSTHGRGGLGRWAHGSVAEVVLRRADVPLLLVPATCRRAWSTDRSLRVIVPLDGSTASEAALGPVKELAAVLPTELHLVRAVSSETSDMAFARGPDEPIVDDPQVDEWEAREYLERVAARLRDGGRKVRTYAQVDFAADVIARVAREQDVDLVAMATHGRGGVARVVLGSVTAKTLRTVPLPLLVVRPAAWRASVVPGPAPAAAEAEVRLGPAERGAVELGLRTVIALAADEAGRAAARRALARLDKLAMDEAIGAASSASA